MNPIIFLCTYSTDDMKKVDINITKTPNIKIDWKEHDFFKNNIHYFNKLSALRNICNFGLLLKTDNDVINALSLEVFNFFSGESEIEPIIFSFLKKMENIERFSLLILDDIDDDIFEEEFISFDYLYERLNNPYFGMHTVVYLDDNLYSSSMNNPILINIGFNERYGISSV